MKSLNVMAIAWFVALVFFFVFSAPLSNLLFIGDSLVGLGLGVAGIGIFLVAVFRSRKGFRKCLPVLLIPVIGLILYFTVGFRLGRLALFQIRKSHYEELLSEATRTGELPSGSGYFDEGPPPRFAFYWQRGITDNWAGVVHDDTGTLKRVTELGGVNLLREPEFGEVVRMFGGDLFYCEHLQGDWYLCWFT